MSSRKPSWGEDKEDSKKCVTAFLQLVLCPRPRPAQMRVIDRLPTREEQFDLRHLILEKPSPEITDEDVANILPHLAQLESVCLSGLRDTLSDRTVCKLTNLVGVDLRDCHLVSNVGIVALVASSSRIEWIIFAGIVGEHQSRFASFTTHLSYNLLCRNHRSVDMRSSENDPFLG